jgi:hypothetical protein
MSGSARASTRSISRPQKRFPTLSDNAASRRQWPVVQLLSFLRHRDVEAVEGQGDHAVEADEIDELGHTFEAELRDALFPGELGQDAARDERGGEVVGDLFLARQVARSLAQTIVVILSSERPRSSAASTCA